LTIFDDSKPGAPGFLYGHIPNELQELVENADETGDLLRLGLHRLPIGEFPLLRSLASPPVNAENLCDQRYS
jgi:hypothetical protein